MTGSRQFNREKGRTGERLAVEFLKSNGIIIDNTNFYTRCGEIDIVGKDGKTLVFFEVKYRRNGKCGSPAEAVGFYKKRHIVNAARFYLYRYGYRDGVSVRFDVISITGNDIQWIKSAFDCSGLNI
ncbi:MAG: YraN family protein [Lachnospiraceae bacterium]|nr:YraN family protein [Lachnospiraceae bacterium]